MLSNDTQKEVWQKVSKLSDRDLAMCFMNATKTISASYEWIEKEHTTEWLLQEAEKILAQYEQWFRAIRKIPDNNKMPF